jgi:hypothetical protein
MLAFLLEDTYAKNRLNLLSNLKDIMASFHDAPELGNYANLNHLIYNPDLQYRMWQIEQFEQSVATYHDKDLLVNFAVRAGLSKNSKLQTKLAKLAKAESQVRESQEHVVKTCDAMDFNQLLQSVEMPIEIPQNSIFAPNEMEIDALLASIEMPIQFLQDSIFGPNEMDIDALLASVEMPGQKNSVKQYSEKDNDVIKSTMEMRVQKDEEFLKACDGIDFSQLLQSTETPSEIDEPILHESYKMEIDTLLAQIERPNQIKQNSLNDTNEVELDIFLATIEMPTPTQQNSLNESSQKELDALLGSIQMPAEIEQNSLNESSQKELDALLVSIEMPTEINIFPCNSCDEIFWSKNCLRCHIAKCHRLNNSCKYCPNVFRHEAQLHRHVENVHTVLGQYGGGIKKHDAGEVGNVQQSTSQQDGKSVLSKPTQVLDNQLKSQNGEGNDDDSNSSQSPNKRQKMSQDADNDAYLINLRESKQFNNGVIDHIFDVKFNEKWQGADLTDILGELNSMFEELMDKAREGRAPNDLVRIVIHHNDLYGGPIIVPLRPWQEMAVADIMNTIERVQNSRQTLVIDDSFQITVSSIELPKGGHNAIPITSTKGYKNSIFHKRSFIEIKNKDNMCMSRAIIMAWANQIKTDECLFSKDYPSIEEACVYRVAVVKTMYL